MAAVSKTEVHGQSEDDLSDVLCNRQLGGTSASGYFYVISILLVYRFGCRAGLILFGYVL